jgi:thioredoxin reductase (NADPH)
VITAELLRPFPLFDGVPMHELHAIADRAADIDLRAGDWLISEGEEAAFFGLLTGRLEVLKDLGGEPQRIKVYHANETFGEIPLLLDAPSVASLRALETARAFRLDATDFRTLVLDCEALNARITATMSSRVADLQQVAIAATKPEVTIVGHRWDLDCHDVRDFLLRNHITFVWLDPGDEYTADRIPADLRDAKTYPVLLLADGARLVAPTLRELADAVHLRTAPSSEEYDLAIVGGGPAGLAAAVYGASEGLRTVLIEREAPGGQAGTSSRIENYLGFPTGLSGDELGKRALRQAIRLGAEVVVARAVDRIKVAAPGEPHELVLDGAERVRARAIVVATGVAWRTLDVPGCGDLLGRGVYYGAARTEAVGTRGKRVHLVGGGNSAGQAAMYFSSYAEAVTILVRGDGLAATMSSYLIDELATKPNVTIEAHSEVTAAHGPEHLTALDITDPRTGEVRTVESDALFIFIGADAETAWLPDAVIRDRAGYVCTGRDVMDLLAASQAGTWTLDRDPFLLETSIPGIFAAGDVRHGSVKRVASSVGEGSMTVAFIHQYLANEAPAPPVAATGR